MAAAAAVTVAVMNTRLAIALIFKSVHLAAVSSSVLWNVIPRILRRQARKQVVFVTIVLVVSKRAVVNERGHGSGAERALNERVALKVTVLRHLSAALARTVRVSFA